MDLHVPYMRRNYEKKTIGQGVSGLTRLTRVLLRAGRAFQRVRVPTQRMMTVGKR